MKTSDLMRQSARRRAHEGRIRGESEREISARLDADLEMVRRMERMERREAVTTTENDK